MPYWWRYTSKVCGECVSRMHHKKYLFSKTAGLSCIAVEKRHLFASASRLPLKRDLAFRACKPIFYISVPCYDRFLNANCIKELPCPHVRYCCSRMLLIFVTRALDFLLFRTNIEQQFHVLSKHCIKCFFFVFGFHAIHEYCKVPRNYNSNANYFLSFFDYI